jgi:hypothetical protein
MRDRIGQFVNFASVLDPDATYSRFAWIRAQRGDTVRKIAARRSQPEMALTILNLNLGADVLVHKKPRPHQKRAPVPKLRSITQTLRAGAPLKLPGTMSAQYQLSVHAGDEPPTVKKGYAAFSEVAVQGRVGISRFDGYPPIAIDIPIQFEGVGSPGAGGVIEANIAILERMAGRGDYPGAAYGPPAVIVVTSTDNAGNPIPLIPFPYQWSPQHQNAMQFRVTNLTWGPGALRDDQGRRIRQAATVEITQYTPLMVVVRSVAQRTAQKRKTTSKAKA